MDDHDSLESLFSLEDQFYDEGFQEGLADGRRAGRLEGRVFGIERGFEKYVALGRIQGRAAVWRARMAKPSQGEKAMMIPPVPPSDASGTAKGLVEDGSQLPPWPDNARLVKHVQGLQSLVAPGHLSFENTEEAIANLESRLKRAMAKMKVIERITGEAVVVNESGHCHGVHGDAKDDVESGKSGPAEPGDDNIEAIRALNLRR